MRIFVAGATGAIGRRLLPLLGNDGHHVVATTRTPQKLQHLERQGATGVLMDALNRDTVLDAVANARPDVIIHQMTPSGLFAVSGSSMTRSR